MKNRVYYHGYLDDYFSWAHIFTDQMCLMEKDGLMSNIDMMKITVISKKDKRLDIFANLCKSFPANFEIEVIESKYGNDFEMLEDWSHLQGDAVKPISETHTLTKLYDDCKREEMNILYLHTKAVTSVSNCLIKYGHASKFKNRHLWRQLMNWGTITYWRMCVDQLKTNDAVGIDYQTTPPHFKGNFWWATSNHINALPDPRDDNWWINFKNKSNDPWIRNLSNRFRDEFWICSKENTKAFNIRPNNGYYVENDI
jgi:hypothetical protein